MSNAENVVFFDLVLSIMLLTFGLGVTGQQPLAAFQTIAPPVLAPQPGNIHCSAFDWGCQATQGVAQATAYIGWAIVNLPVIIVFFIQEFVVFLNIMLSITFSPTFRANGVPFLGYIWSGLQVYVIWEAIRTFRGSSTGV